MTRVAHPPVSPWNIANALTVLRVLLVPVFAWAMLYDSGQSAWWRGVAAGVFLAAVLTDRFDGDLARRYGLVTNFGKIADPIADKALIGTALVGLSVIGQLPWAVTAVVIAREVAVTVLRFAVIRHGVMPASRGGKLKTVLQAVAITLYLLPIPEQWQWPIHVVMAAAVVVTLVTGVDYAVQAVRMRRQSLRSTERVGSGTRR